MPFFVCKHAATPILESGASGWLLRTVRREKSLLALSIEGDWFCDQAAEGITND